MRRTPLILLTVAALLVISNGARIVITSAYAGDQGVSSSCKPGGICDVQETRCSASPGQPCEETLHPGARHYYGQRKTNDWLAGDGGRIYAGPNTKMEATDFCPQDGGACAFGTGGPTAFVRIVGDTMSGGLSAPDFDGGRIDITPGAGGQDAVFLNKNRIVWGTQTDGGSQKCRSNGAVVICTEGNGDTVISLSKPTMQFTSNTFRITDGLHSGANTNMVYLDSDHTIGIKVGAVNGNTESEGHAATYFYPLNALAADAGLLGVEDNAGYPLFNVTNRGRVTAQYFCPIDGGTCFNGGGAGGLANVVNAWTAHCLGATNTTVCGTDSNFIGAFKGATNSTNAALSCSWGTTGSGGTTGVVGQVYDVTAGAEICHCTLGACNTAALVPLSCNCTGTYVAGNLYVVRLTSATDCGTRPANIVCNAQYTMP